MTEHTLLVLLAGALFAVGMFMLLRRNLLRAFLGLALLSNAVNLLIVAMGRLDSAVPALVAEGAEGPAAAVANPLPQALVLTAIVIGFGLMSFALVLARRAYDRLGTLDADALSPGSSERSSPSRS